MQKVSLHGRQILLSLTNSVTKRVRIQECYREFPAGEREHRMVCGRWLLRGAAERSGQHVAEP